MSATETKPNAAARDPRAIAFAQRVMRALSAASPAAAAALAEQLFVLPRRHTAPAHEVAVRARAVRSFTIPHEGLQLDALSWGSGDRLVLLAHGWEGRGTQLGYFVDPLVAAGFRVVAFDGPAHGRSPGRRADIVAHSRVFASVVKAEGPVHCVVAHSFGGGACMTALHLGSFEAERLVFIGVPAGMEWPLGAFRQALDLREPVWSLFLARMERRFGVPLEAASIRSGAPSAPGLVIHCHDDTEVDFANAEAIHQAWPGSRLMATDGLGHRRILKDGGVIAAAVEFLAA